MNSDDLQVSSSPVTDEVVAGIKNLPYTAATLGSEALYGINTALNDLLPDWIFGSGSKAKTQTEINKDPILNYRANTGMVGVVHDVLGSTIGKALGVVNKGVKAVGGTRAAEIAEDLESVAGPHDVAGVKDVAEILNEPGLKPAFNPSSSALTYVSKSLSLKNVDKNLSDWYQQAAEHTEHAKMGKQEWDELVQQFPDGMTVIHPDGRYSIVHMNDPKHLLATWDEHTGTATFNVSPATFDFTKTGKSYADYQTEKTGNHIKPKFSAFDSLEEKQARNKSIESEPGWRSAKYDQPGQQFSISKAQQDRYMEHSDVTKRSFHMAPELEHHTNLNNSGTKMYKHAVQYYVDFSKSLNNEVLKATERYFTGHPDDIATLKQVMDPEHWNAYRSLQIHLTDPRNALKQPLVTHSGIGPALHDVLKELPIGQDIPLNSFVSSSRNLREAIGFSKSSAIVHFDLPAGFSNGRDITSLSSLYKEQEFILAAGKRWRLKDRYQEGVWDHYVLEPVGK